MEYGSIFNKNDYVVLEMLIAEECNSPYKSLTKQFIIKDSGFSHVKIQSVIKSFLLVGFVKEGLKDGNKQTYYYTEKGKEHYMQVLEYSEEDIKILIENNKEKHINN